MEITLSPSSLDDYRTFLKVKSLPVYRVTGRSVWFPDEYASLLGVAVDDPPDITYAPRGFLFDYQRDIVDIALRKQKYALFCDCGLGKTLMYFEYLRHVMDDLRPRHRGALILSPLMVVEQTLAEARRWYPDLPIESVSAHDLPEWLRTCDGRIGICNYDALKSDCEQGQLGCLILDESSVLKSHYGKYGRACIRLGKGLRWKLCGTGTPAPNDRIEYANHAVFLDQYPTVNAFLARYFINRGQTSERWVLKPHAIEPFYRTLSHWSIFLTNPATYGWKDNCESLPPIHVHIEDLDMTADQHRAVRRLTGGLVSVKAGGITKRSAMSRIAKGLNGEQTVKYDYIRGLVGEWSHSTIVWCWANAEQDRMEQVFPEAASIQGSTPYAKRQELLDDFKSGRRKVLISKPKVLGFGLNLQIATRQVFSSLIDSYEQYYQAIKRSNRYGSTEPLHVYIPVLDVELPMVENVLRKARLVQHDTEEQERIFKQYAVQCIGAQ